MPKNVERLVKKLKRRPGVENPYALANYIIKRHTMVGKGKK